MVAAKRSSLAGQRRQQSMGAVHKTTC
jgi:hypothetical protein